MTAVVGVAGDAGAPLPSSGIGRVDPMRPYTIESALASTSDTSKLVVGAVSVSVSRMPGVGVAHGQRTLVVIAQSAAARGCSDKR